MGFRENLKAELLYSGMLVKELAAKSGVNKYSLDGYLNIRGQMPSVETAVKLAHALGVSVEYLATGQDHAGSQLSREARAIGRLAEQLTGKNRETVLDFMNWLKARQ